MQLLPSLPILLRFDLSTRVRVRVCVCVRVRVHMCVGIIPQPTRRNTLAFFRIRVEREEGGGA